MLSELLTSDMKFEARTCSLIVLSEKLYMTTTLIDIPSFKTHLMLLRLIKCMQPVCTLVCCLQQLSCVSAAMISHQLLYLKALRIR
jgi:hypothetical protein